MIMDKKQRNKDDEILYLLKTMKYKYLKDTMTKGRFCFNHPAVFSQWEDSNAAQYDRWEAHSAYAIKSIAAAPIIGEKNGMPVYGPVVKVAEKGIIRLQNESVKHSPICCFRYIERKDFQLIDNEMVYSLGDTATRIIDEFGHDTFVIIQVQPFLGRIKRKAKQFMAMDVAYHDLLNNHPFDVDEKYKDVVEQLFRKDKKYEWQKEYRIVLPPSEESPVFLEIGSIEDIAICGDLADLKD